MLYVLQNVFEKTKEGNPFDPDKNVGFFNQAIVARKKGTGQFTDDKHPLYFFTYNQLVKTDDNNKPVKPFQDEGRLILSDALYEGASEKPTMMVDCATLTGAARVALGTDLPALFCNDDALADDLIDAGKSVTDPMWRMPLFAGYRRLLDSKVADINNAPGVAFGGAITAALYLKEFVPDDVPWAHFDMMAWNNSSRPGRPEGGEAQAARAIFAAIEKRVAK